MALMNIKLDELFAAAEEAPELSTEDLEGVSGGTIGLTAQVMLRTAITKYKGEGVTLDQALEAMPSLFDELSTDPQYAKYLKQTNLEEVTAFVIKNW